MRAILTTFAGIAAFAVIAGAPLAANAYIGPGAGITAIGTLVALIGAVFLVIVGFLWYPIKRLRRALKERKANTEKEQDAEAS